MSKDSSHLHRLKERLPHTWAAFLGRHGRFTEIQALAVEPILAGQNCILVSATASGKTEAALMPLIERLKRFESRESRVGNQKSKTQRTLRNRLQTPDARRQTLELLYIVPTRALTRDLARRLQQPLAQLAITMNIKTGDEPALQASRPPQLLLTTPESLDSLLANRPRMLKDVRVVVLDEIHLYDNTARGDHLRVLLNRVRRLRNYAFSRGDSATDEVQFCALSATVNEPCLVAARYFSNPVVVKADGQRQLDAELLEMQDADGLKFLFADLQRRSLKKALAFCNSRAECEELAHRFRAGTPFGDRVFVHHASLDVRMRHATERNFAMAEAALCFATSTLELGIDIGDVDLVILIGAPENTSAFLQRIGRGNRRAGRTAVVCFYRTVIEAALFQVFVRAAQAGELEPNHYFFRPAIVAQQLCSYLKQMRLGEIHPDTAYELFATPDGAPLISKHLYDEIVAHLIAKAYFVAQPNGVLKPGREWQRLYEQRAIYANLKDTRRASLEVFDEMTNRRLGEIEFGTSRGATFLFGGKARRTARMQGRKLIVRATDEEAATPRFRSPHKPLSRELAKAVALELGLPQANSENEIAMALDKEDEIAMTLDKDRQGVEGDASSNQAWIFHCAGQVYGLTLGDLLETLYGVKVKEQNEFCFLLTGSLPAQALRFSAAQVRARVRRRWQQFEAWFDMGSFHTQIPANIRAESVIEAFNVEAFLRIFADRKITEAVAMPEEPSEFP